MRLDLLEELKYLKQNDWTVDDMKECLNEDDNESVENIQKNLGYFISYENLFSTWIGMGPDFNVSNVRDALSAFNRLIEPSYKKVFENSFFLFVDKVKKYRIYRIIFIFFKKPKFCESAYIF